MADVSEVAVPVLSIDDLGPMLTFQTDDRRMSSDLSRVTSETSELQELTILFQTEVLFLLLPYICQK